MTDAVKVALAQIDLVVGDVAGNTAKIIDYAKRARDRRLRGHRRISGTECLRIPA